MIDAGNLRDMLDMVGDLAKGHFRRGVRCDPGLHRLSGTIGLAFNLEENSVGVIILGDYLSIQEGDEVIFDIVEGEKGPQADRVIRQTKSMPSEPVST